MSLSKSERALLEVMKVLFRPHPWHGVSMGDRAPDVVTCYIEIIPTDTVKYEIDKTSGYLKVDRPQLFSSTVPCLYGLIPQTYCGSRVAQLASTRTGRAGITGDGDPLDVCVLTERPISHGDLLLDAIPIGGLKMLDREEADDKIVAVLSGDAVYGKLSDISECPKSLVERLVHYFLTYKQMPGEGEPHCEVTETYGRREAHRVIQEARADYDESFAHLPDLMHELLRELATRG